MKFTSLVCAWWVANVVTFNPSVVAQSDQNRQGAHNNSSNKDKGDTTIKYEVWASDQSNSAPGQLSLGVKGSYLWIFDSDDIETQLNGGPPAPPQSCSPDSDSKGPCDILQVFPQNLKEYGGDGKETGKTLGDLDGFGRLHGVLADPSNRYITANMFAPDGGYVGVIDTKLRQAVGLFRVTKFNFSPSSSSRSVHMSFWAKDGASILIANLNGKAVERINVFRDDNGIITDLEFDKSASLGLGKSQSVAEDATYFMGLNQWQVPLKGSVSGDYAIADLNDLTPSGVCKENGCSGGTGEAGGRPNNLPICPIASKNGFLYITLGGGGLLVADHTTTPMAVVGEYGNAIVYGAGCGGVEVDNKMMLNAGVSASGAGATQSMFALFSFDDNAFPSGDLILSKAFTNAQNTPMPLLIFQDSGNTLSGGNAEGNKSTDVTGQKPGVTTRRDSHGAVAHPNGEFVYVVDRIQNVMEVFGVETCERYTFDLVSKTGQDGRSGPVGDCYTRSVRDDPKLPLNDPAPDLLSITPDGKYIMTALRGPSPVTVSHGGQGSCPGVGIVELLEGGKSGRMVGVIRTTNTNSDDLVDVTDSTFPGGVAYVGAERSDIHGVLVIVKSM